MSTTPVKPVDLTSPAALAAKSWVEGIAHSNVLREWLAHGQHKDLAECRRRLARGDACTDHQGCDTAILLFTRGAWLPTKCDETRQLMLDYIAAGIIRIDARFMTANDGLSYFSFNGLLPLELAMTLSHADATCVLLESGAMDVTSFAGVLTDFGEGEPQPGEAFDAFARSQFASSPESMARFTEIILRRRLEAVTTPAAAETFEAQERAPLRRKRMM